MFWKRQNRRDREILAAMMLSGHRPYALEIFTTAHWKKTDTPGRYEYHDRDTIIRATDDDGVWAISIRPANYILDTFQNIQ